MAVKMNVLFSGSNPQGDMAHRCKRCARTHGLHGIVPRTGIARAPKAGADETVAGGGSDAHPVEQTYEDGQGPGAHSAAAARSQRSRARRSASFARKAAASPD